MSALAQMLAGALGAGGPPQVRPAPQSMHGPQGMGPSPVPQQSARIPMPMPAPPPIASGGALPGVAPRAPAPMGPKPPRAAPGAPASARTPPTAGPRHADTENEKEDKGEKPGDEEEEDTMMGAAKRALKSKPRSEFKPKKGPKNG